MDHGAVTSAAQSIREHIEIVETVYADPNITERNLELEILGRCNKIEARLAQMRAGVMRKSSKVPA